MREDLLKKELDELHNYLRSNFQSLLAWFTFYCTIVVGATAWSFTASLDDRRHVMTSIPTLFVAGFYTVQTIFGLLGCNCIKRDFANIRIRIAAIQSDLIGAGGQPPLQPEAGVPSIVIDGTKLMIWTLWSLLPFLWLGYLAMVKHLGIVTSH